MTMSTRPDPAEPFRLQPCRPGVNRKPLAYVLVGPTAVGKTAVAHHLAKLCGGSILSADSMLVYAGMDIGTAKPSHAELKEVPYFGIDLATPDRLFSAGDYMAAVHSIFAEGRIDGARPLIPPLLVYPSSFRSVSA